VNEQPFENVYFQSRAIEVMSQFGSTTPTIFVSARGTWGDRHDKLGEGGRLWIDFFFRRSPFSQPDGPAAREPLGIASFLILNGRGETVSYGTGAIVSFGPPPP